MTLDEWVEKNAEDLRVDIEAHMYCGSHDNLIRLIMISVRQWYELKSKESNNV